MKHSIGPNRQCLFCAIRRSIGWLESRWRVCVCRVLNVHGSVAISLPRDSQSFLQSYQIRSIAGQIDSSLVGKKKSSWVLSLLVRGLPNLCGCGMSTVNSMLSHRTGISRSCKLTVINTDLLDAVRWCFAEPKRKHPDGLAVMIIPIRCFTCGKVGLNIYICISVCVCVCIHTSETLC